MGVKGFEPFFLEKIFKDFSRTQIDFKHLNPFTPKISK